MPTAVVLLSGGMDSCVVLFWARTVFQEVHCITFDYGQRAFINELRCAVELFKRSGVTGAHHICDLRFVIKTPSSLTGQRAVTQYRDVQEAVEQTDADSAYIPLRNAIFLPIAANFLLSKNPAGGQLLLGTRQRADGPGGFPDCTRKFAELMTDALSEGAAADVTVTAPLNELAPSRVKTIELAMQLPGCYDALAHTVSCFFGTRCGKCLPCLRRAQAFAALGKKDPAT